MEREEGTTWEDRRIIHLAAKIMFGIIGGVWKRTIPHSLIDRGAYPTLTFTYLHSFKSDMQRMLEFAAHSAASAMDPHDGYFAPLIRGSSAWPSTIGSTTFEISRSNLVLDHLFYWISKRSHTEPWYWEMCSVILFCTLTDIMTTMINR